MKNSPNSCPSTVLTPHGSRWLRAGRHCLALLVVAGVGGMLMWAGRANVQAANAAKAAKKAAPMAKLNHQGLAREIDRMVLAKLRENEVDVSGRSNDAEFIRRAHLDITGVIPTADRVEKFLNSTDPNKRAKLIDELLDSPRFGKYLAEVWTKDWVPQISNNRRLNNAPLRDWVAKRLNEKVPAWDKIVYDVVTASGPQNENGAVTFFIGNFGPDQVTNKLTKHFLGVQLQCAQCHDHPFTDWKQDEYWGMASFFQKVGLNVNPNQAAKQGIQPTIKEYNPQDLRNPRTRGKKTKAKKRIRVRLFRIPKDGKKVAPKFLLAENPDLDRADPYRPTLAKWMTSKNNRFFARAIANKMWHHFFGRGLVNPYNDMHDDNPSSHPEVLKAIEEQVKRNNFDLKYIVRAICNSETYQRSSRAKGNNGDEKELFSRALVRQLNAEQMYDSLELITRSEKQTTRTKGRKRKVPNRRRGQNARSQFIQFFTGDDGHKPLEYQAGIPQALRLMNSRQLAGAGMIASAMKSGKNAEDVVERLYLAALSRRPTAAEMQRLTQYVSKQGNARTAYGDILWALLNSSEFALNH